MRVAPLTGLVAVVFTVVGFLLFGDTPASWPVAASRLRAFSLAFTLRCTVLTCINSPALSELLTLA